ncbi:hypothetical protein [Cupriavidus sp. 8B]
MALTILVGYALVYFAGKYGAYFLNLLFKRVIFGNLRYAGLGALLIAGIFVTWLIGRSIAGTGGYAWGYLFGSYVVFPIMVVTMGVAITIWREGRKNGARQTTPKKLY